MSTKPDPRVDAYIAKSAAFAQPILRHLRSLVQKACPAATETIKWSCPHFTSGDAILCSMAAFKAHCAFGFWHQGMQDVLRADGVLGEDAMGSLGRITSIEDLPADKKLIGYIRQAADLIASHAPARSKAQAKAPSPIPADLAAALKKNKTAAATFEKFSASHRREYIEWITEAKRTETREKRLATTLEWLAEGKARNWKYANC